MKQKKIESCVFKRDWKNYKTCYECGTMRKCERADKPGWFGRLTEQIIVGWYRWRINKKLRKMFHGARKKSVQRALHHRAVRKTPLNSKH